jgi:hypothetical protein
VTTFSLYAFWTSATALSDRWHKDFDAAFLPEEGGVCSWVEPTASETLRVCFDVEACSYEEAIEIGRSLITTAANTAGLEGGLSRLTAMDLAGSCEWSTGESTG